jgi:hypothetical protein
MRLGGCPNKTS